MTGESNTNTSTGARIDSWLADAAARQEAHARLLPLNKAALFDALTAAGITQVAVSFDGYGDAGQVEHIEANAGDAVVALPDREIEMFRAEYGQAEPTRSRLSLAAAIEQLVYDLLEETHSGWEINEGAFGDFAFDVAARAITLGYNERIESSEYTQHEF